MCSCSYLWWVSAKRGEEKKKKTSFLAARLLSTFFFFYSLVSSVKTVTEQAASASFLPSAAGVQARAGVLGDAQGRGAVAASGPRPARPPGVTLGTAASPPLRPLPRGRAVPGLRQRGRSGAAARQAGDAEAAETPRAMATGTHRPWPPGPLPGGGRRPGLPQPLPQASPRPRRRQRPGRGRLRPRGRRSGRRRRPGRHFRRVRGGGGGRALASSSAAAGDTETQSGARAAPPPLPPPRPRAAPRRPASRARPGPRPASFPPPRPGPAMGNAATAKKGNEIESGEWGGRAAASARLLSRRRARGRAWRARPAPPSPQAPRPRAEPPAPTGPAAACAEPRGVLPTPAPPRGSAGFRETSGTNPPAADGPRPPPGRACGCPAAGVRPRWRRSCRRGRGVAGRCRCLRQPSSSPRPARFPHPRTHPAGGGGRPPAALRLRREGFHPAAGNVGQKLRCSPGSCSPGDPAALPAPRGAAPAPRRVYIARARAGRALGTALLSWALGKMEDKSIDLNSSWQGAFCWCFCSFVCFVFVILFLFLFFFFPSEYFSITSNNMNSIQLFGRKP